MDVERSRQEPPPYLNFNILDGLRSKCQPHLLSHLPHIVAFSHIVKRQHQVPSVWSFVHFSLALLLEHHYGRTKGLNDFVCFLLWLTVCQVVQGSPLVDCSLSSGARRIEDKLLQYQLALRPFHLAINLSNLHGNSEQPACYSSMLVVPDHTLPLKGVNYRLPRSGHSGGSESSPAKPGKEDINA